MTYSLLQQLGFERASQHTTTTVVNIHTPLPGHPELLRVTDSGTVNVFNKSIQLALGCDQLALGCDQLALGCESS